MKISTRTRLAIFRAVSENTQIPCMHWPWNVKYWIDFTEEHWFWHWFWSDVDQICPTGLNLLVRYNFCYTNWENKNICNIANIYLFDNCSLLITVRKRSCGKVMFFTPVCDSVHGEVYIPQADSHGQTPSPWADTPSTRQTPPRQTPPSPTRSLQRTVCILLEYILVFMGRGAAGGCLLGVSAWSGTPPLLTEWQTPVKI